MSEKYVPLWVKTRRRRDTNEAGDCFFAFRGRASSIREPYALIAHVRFDERDVETEQWFDTKALTTEWVSNSDVDLKNRDTSRLYGKWTRFDERDVETEQWFDTKALTTEWVSNSDVDLKKRDTSQLYMCRDSVSFN
jgi:hypothetical protein